MLWDPSKRPSAAQVRYKSINFNIRDTVDVTISFYSQILRHNYFKVGQNLSASRAPPAQSRQPLITPQRHGSHQQPAHVPSLPARDLSPFKFDHNKPAPAPAMQHLHKPPAQKAALTPKVYQSFKLFLRLSSEALLWRLQELHVLPESRKRSTGAGLFDSIDNWDDDFDLGLSASKKSSTMKATHGGAAGGGGLSKPMPAIKQPPSIGFGSDFKKKQQQDDDFFG